MRASLKPKLGSERAFCRHLRERSPQPRPCPAVGQRQVSDRHWENAPAQSQTPVHGCRWHRHPQPCHRAAGIALTSLAPAEPPRQRTSKATQYPKAEVLRHLVRRPPHVTTHWPEKGMRQILGRGSRRAGAKPKRIALSCRTRLPPERPVSAHNYLLFLLKSFMRDLSFVLMKTTIFKV